MALKKPSDIFNKKETSGVFESPKISSHITESYDKFRGNFDKVNELYEKVEVLSQELSEKLTKSDLENAMLSQLMVLDENFKSLQNQVKGLNKQDLKDFKETVSNLSEIVHNLVENEIPKYKKQITNNEVRFGYQLKEFKNEVEDKVQDFYQVLNEFNDVVQVIDTVSNIEKYLQEHHQDLITLREEVFSEIGQIPVGNIQENIERLEKKIDFIRETYSKIDSESAAKEIIQEGLLNEPPETKNEDPLTPLNQNFVTLDQLQEHYRLFINRIQQQLSTLGGGGETRLKYLDDIVGIATNASAYDGKFLKYDHSIGKFVFATAGVSTYASTAGIATYASSAGIATYASAAGIATYASTAGISTYSTTAGISTYSSTAGIATYSTKSGIATYADTAGIATSAGTATTATYLSDAANIITGTINKDRISTTNALTVLGNLYVSNNISFGGTVTQLNTEQLNIVDADIVLGIGTSFSPTDNTANHGGIAIASTEGSPLVNLNIVPGETNPTTYKKIMWFKGDTIGAGLTDAWLFNYAVGIGSTNVPNGVRLAVGNVKVTDTNVTATSFTGSLNGNATSATTSTYSTTAGVSTYASSSGIATYATTAGVSTYASTSGVSTYASTAGIATYASTAGIATYASTAGIATYATTTGVSTSVIGGIASVTQLNVSGISTVGFLTAANVSVSGIVTSNGYYITGTQVISSARQLQNIASLDATTTATIESAIANAPNTFTDLQVTGISTFTNGPVFVGSGTSTGTTSQPLQVTGGAYVSGNLGIGITNTSNKLEVSGGNIRFFTASQGDITITHSNLVSTIRGATTTQLALGAGGAEAVRINTTGNVGIQTTAPQGTLQVGAGTSTFIVTGIGYVGIGLTNPTSKLDVVGDAKFTGVLTASSFSGNASSATYSTSAGIATYSTSAGIATYASTAGVSTYASTAGVATALQNARTFEITGDVVASSIIFNGTGNVSLAATIQPNSVALGTDTTGDYVQSVSGTSNQITVTSGTGEGSAPTLSIPSQFTAPQDVTVTRDLQVNRNLNVNGNITIGGTSTTLFTTELKVYDPDLVLGFRTDAFGNDVSTDNTANHGGIAIASTEGNPLVQLFIAGIETTPATYKKIMWFKAGEFSGLGTDAWLSNYAVGIGSTQFPTGTRLAAGAVQFTERDLAVVRNINASGVVTATTFVGALTGTATSTTNIPNLSGDISSNNTVTTLASVNSNVGTYGDAGAIPSITVNAKGLVTGVTTIVPNNGQLSLAVSGTGLSGSATFTANQSGSSTFTVTSNATNANTSSTIVARDASGNFSAGTITANLTGTATTATNLADAANITTGTINSARLSGTYNINVSYASASGIATYATSSGIATYASTAGVSTYSSSAGIATYASRSGISTVSEGLTGTPNITVGVATATSFVKSGGTSSQFLKADGSVDTSTYLTTTGSGINLTDIVTSIVAGTNVTISGSTGQVTINATGGGAADALDILEVMMFS